MSETPKGMTRNAWDAAINRGASSPKLVNAPIVGCVTDISPTVAGKIDSAKRTIRLEECASENERQFVIEFFRNQVQHQTDYNSVSRILEIAESQAKRRNDIAKQRLATTHYR